MFQSRDPDSSPERSFWPSSSPPSLSAAACVPSPPPVSSPPPLSFSSPPPASAYGSESHVPTGQRDVVRQNSVQDRWIHFYLRSVLIQYSYCYDVWLTLDSMSRAFSSCASFSIFSISSIFNASIPLALRNRSKSLLTWCVCVLGFRFSEELCKWFIKPKSWTGYGFDPLEKTDKKL